MYHLRSFVFIAFVTSFRTDTIFTLLKLYYEKKPISLMGKIFINDVFPYRVLRSEGTL